MELEENKKLGEIKFVNYKAKFGFIRDIHTQEEFYFKISDLKTKETELDGLVFSFELKEARRGPQAINICRVEK